MPRTLRGPTKASRLLLPASDEDRRNADNDKQRPGFQFWEHISEANGKSMDLWCVFFCVHPMRDDRFAIRVSS